MKPSKKFRESFIEWCEKKENPTEQFPSFRDWKNQEDLKELTEIEVGNLFVETIQKRIDNHRLVYVTVNEQWTSDRKLVGRGKKGFDTDIVGFEFQRGIYEVTFNNLTVRSLIIQGYQNTSLVFENCRIADMRLGSPRHQYETKLVLNNTWIGNLELYAACSKNFEMVGGGIFNLDCPPPDSDNPFTGSVTFQRVFLPRTAKVYPIEGPQPYRNLRAHLLKLENGPAVNFIHAAEQALERETDTRFNKFLSYLYQCFSDYGSSTWRPVGWLASLLAFNVFLIHQVDGATHALPDEFYVGWRENLVDSGSWGQASRAIVLALQSIFNPFGIFGARTLVVADQGWLNAWLGISGLLSALLIALLIFALRRRFKIR